MNAAELAEWQQKYRDAVQPQVSEPVEAAWVFYRTGGFASMSLSKGSSLAAGGGPAHSEREAGGLSNSFVLACTPTHVHAFAYKPRGVDVNLGEELAVWARHALQVTSQAAEINTTVTLESAEEGERVVCSTGRDEASLAMIRTLQTPAPAPAAA